MVVGGHRWPPTEAEQQPEMAFARFGPRGTEQGTTAYGSETSLEQLFDIAPLPNGSIAVRGSTADLVSGDGRAEDVVARLNASGEAPWGHMYSQNDRVGRRLATDTAGNVILIGGGEFAWIRKFDGDGDEVWRLDIDEFGGGLGDVAVGPNGSIVAVGETVSEPFPATGCPVQGFAISVSAEGDLEWSRDIAGRSSNWDLALDREGGFVVATPVGTEACESKAVHVARYASDGELDWETTLADGAASIRHYDVAVDRDGRIFVSIEEDGEPAVVEVGATGVIATLPWEARVSELAPGPSGGFYFVEWQPWNGPDVFEGSSATAGLRCPG